MIADDIRLPPDKPHKPDGIVGEGKETTLVRPETVGGWRAFAIYSQTYGQVTVGLDVFLDMLDQIEGLKP